MSGQEITKWLQNLANGDEMAAQAIWGEYFGKLVRLARRHLEGLPRRTRDEEDVALSAINAFYRGAAAGNYPRLNDRNDLGNLLVTITVHKAMAEARRVRAQKRGGGAVRGESAFVYRDAPEAARGLEQVMAEEATPAMACMLAENCRNLLDQLDDESLRSVALYKMEGYSNEQVAKELKVTVRTVERKLRRIRARWEQSQG